MTTMNKPDVYDEEVAYLTAHPERIHYHWNGFTPLFQEAAPTEQDLDACLDCGCLTQIRQGSYEAFTDELTSAIRADERIPLLPTRITPKDLPVFAEWQRRLDQELKREPPPKTWME